MIQGVLTQNWKNLFRLQTLRKNTNFIFIKTSTENGRKNKKDIQKKKKNEPR